MNNLLYFFMYSKLCNTLCCTVMSVVIHICHIVGVTRLVCYKTFLHVHRVLNLFTLLTVLCTTYCVICNHTPYGRIMRNHPRHIYAYILYVHMHVYARSCVHTCIHGRRVKQRPTTSHLHISLAHIFTVMHRSY